MNYLIFGGTGTLGNQLTDKLIEDENNKIFIFSRDENKQWIMKKKYNNPNIKFYIGDIRNQQRIKECLIEASPNVIILASAMKHIDICEENPYESIETNILGIKNCIESALLNENYLNLISFLFISTDKACNPINIYGQCKSISEKLIFNASTKKTNIKFLCVRYGNVFDSRGSIIDLLKNHKMEYISETHPDMTRFFLSKKEAECLIFDCLKNGQNGELWVRKSPSFLIKNILTYFSIKNNKEIRCIGIRKGEKMHEELFSIYESQNIKSYGSYFIYNKNGVEKSVNSSFDNSNYSSVDCNLSYEETVNYIENNI